MTMNKILKDNHIKELIRKSNEIYYVKNAHPDYLTIDHSHFRVYIHLLISGNLSIECLNLNEGYDIEFSSTEEFKYYILHADSLSEWALGLPIDLRRIKYIPGSNYEAYMVDNILKIQPFEYGCSCEPLETGFNLSLDGLNFSVMNDESLGDAIILLTKQNN